MTGHLLGASGAVEVIACLISMNENFIPPTANLREPDPKCGLNVTPVKAEEKEVNKAVSFSAGFGGHVAAIALGKI